METFLAFVRDTANQPVYVHCEAGKGRTGTACACYRIAVDHWSADQAIAEAKSYGLAMPNQIAFIKKFADDVAAGKAG
jgi:protein tyrosine/serine phosphatase